MICPMVSFPLTLSDPEPRFQGHGGNVDVLCAQLTRDLFAIATLLFFFKKTGRKGISCMYGILRYSCRRYHRFDIFTPGHGEVRRMLLAVES